MNTNNTNINNLFEQYSTEISNKVTSIADSMKNVTATTYIGRIKSALGSIIIATLHNVKIGDLCQIRDDSIGLELYAEAVAIHNEEIKLLVFGSIESISSNAIVVKASSNFTIKLGDFVLGKVLDGLGNTISSMTDDGILADNNLANNNVVADKNSFQQGSEYSVMCLAPNPLTRRLVDTPLMTGVKSLDLFVTCGRGQRIAIFAGPGMGKTTLMGMIIRNTEADVIVVALIGERGREVREFIDLELDAESRKKCVLVVVTSDRPPVEQVKAAYVAQTVAEYFRDQGKNVLIFMDSITRFARAQREVGLSAGEPITRGGYPPSVFLSFPKLMERAGNSDIGSITAFYTVLMEGEVTNMDPIADEVKSIVDGHILLTRKLAEQGHFPAVNILGSLSRVADRIIDKRHQDATRRTRLLLSKHDELEFLLRVGEYKRGNDKLADEAIDKQDAINKLLQQGIHESCEFTTALADLTRLVL
jgi:type III secretion protein N (ATPase)